MLTQSPTHDPYDPSTCIVHVIPGGGDVDAAFDHLSSTAGATLAEDHNVFLFGRQKEEGGANQEHAGVVLFPGDGRSQVGGHQEACRMLT